MGAEIPHKYGGPEASFFMVNLIVEGLARVDPSVSVFHMWVFYWQGDLEWLKLFHVFKFRSCKPHSRPM
jgi:alkylation response protein AidB-like acyl-CoA dehydrogenase